MSTKKRVRVIVERAALDVPQAPPTNNYRQISGDIMKALDALDSVVPRVAMGPGNTTHFVKTHKNVSLDALSTVVNAVEQTPQLTVVGSLDTSVGRDTLEFHDFFQPVYDKLGLMRDLLGFELDSRKALLTNDAFQTYSIAKGVARKDIAAGIHVRNIKKALGRRGGKPAKAKNPPQLKTSADEPVPQEVPEKT